MSASHSGSAPSALGLVRLSRRPLFPPGGKDLYRQIAILTDMGEGDEVLVASCGRGITLNYFAQEYGVHGSGVDEDQALIDATEFGLTDGQVRSRVQLQQAEMDDLPYRDGVFDVVVGELGLTSRVCPDAAIQELTRVLKPLGSMVLVQLVWKAPVDAERRARLSSHLGARPVMFSELQRMLESAGVVRMHTEAWSDEETASRSSARKPFPDFADLFGWGEKLAILRLARRRWGWRGALTALVWQAEAHRLLTKERVLGLDLIVGRRSTESIVQSNQEGQEIADLPPESPAEAADDGEYSTDVRPEGQTLGLPLFARGEEG